MSNVTPNNSPTATPLSKIVAINPNSKISISTMVIYFCNALRIAIDNPVMIKYTIMSVCYLWPPVTVAELIFIKLASVLGRGWQFYLSPVSWF